MAGCKPDRFFAEGVICGAVSFIRMFQEITGNGEMSVSFSICFSVKLFFQPGNQLPDIRFQEKGFCIVYRISAADQK